MTTQQPQCKNRECGRPSPYGTICYHCVDHCRQQLENIRDTHTLLAIARGQEKPATRNTITNKNSTHQQDALNITAYSLYHDITHRWPNMLNTLHRQPDATHHYHQIIQGVTLAQAWIHGEKETPTNHAYLQHRMQQIPSLQAKDAAQYLKAHLNVHVTAPQIRKWRQRGKLRPRTVSPTGRVYYHPADILKALENDRRATTVAHEPMIV